VFSWLAKSDCTLRARSAAAPTPMLPVTYAVTCARPSSFGMKACSQYAILSSGACWQLMMIS
jgi:hypothetical protein